LVLELLSGFAWRSSLLVSPDRRSKKCTGVKVATVARGRTIVDGAAAAVGYRLRVALTGLVSD
jgi:hypothetical protein